MDSNFPFDRPRLGGGRWWGGRDDGEAPSNENSWRGLFDQLTDWIGSRTARLIPPDRLQAAMQTAELLLSRSGDAEGVRIAGVLADLLRQLDDAELVQFFLHLVSKFGADENILKAAVDGYLQTPGQDKASALYAAAEPRRQELIRRLNMAPQGTALIVKLREKVLEMLPAHPELAPLSADLHHLLSSWFNRGFLKAEPINWNSPAAILENIVKYEAVHEIRDWTSLRSRLRGNRRCFAFFHPAMAGVPLIFIEVALTTEMEGAITPLLSRADEEQPLKAPTTAIFYSINNCQPGLKSISLGDLLIKQVVLDLRTEFPSLKKFATLSPIPGFRRWLTSAETKSQIVPPMVSDALKVHEWWLDPDLVEQVRTPLQSLCARYLTGMKPDGSQGRVSDPVARFHLSNGARLERLNWLADVSAKGIAESCGMMVNYSYRLSSIEANHRAFVAEGQVTTSKQIKQLCESNSGAQKFSLTSWLPSLGKMKRLI
jgi:malonyl-CoA decarboxylase